MSIRPGGTATDHSILCPVCGGGTYTLSPGTVWCPSEDAHAGGFFVSRADGRVDEPRPPRVTRVTVTPVLTGNLSDGSEDNLVLTDPIHTL